MAQDRPQVERRAGRTECGADGASARSASGGRGPAGLEAVGWVQGKALAVLAVRGGAIPRLMTEVRILTIVWDSASGLFDDRVL